MSPNYVLQRTPGTFYVSTYHRGPAPLNTALAMLPLRLGYFPSLKGESTVLLSGSSEAVGLLSAELARFVASAASAWAVHEHVLVPRPHSVRLFASRTPPPSASDGFYWPCGAADFPSVLSRLSAVAAATEAHHYFTLAPSTAQLLVSVGEYSEQWWAQHV